MDLNDRIAARRAQLARDEAEEKAALRHAEERQREGERAAAKAAQDAAETERRKALDSVVADLGEAGSQVVRDDDGLALAPTAPAFDPAALKQSEIDRLLHKEARRRFTPGENWQVIGSIVAGFTTIHLAGLGIIGLLFGFWRRAKLLALKRAELRASYPELFGAPDDEPVLAEPTLAQRLFWNPHAKG